MRDHVLLYVNGQRHAVRGAAVYRPLTELLRRDLGLTGTKVVCAEGDCGACTVLLGRPTADGMRYAGIDACIQYLWQVDGASVVTVEALRDGEVLHPAQRAMVDCHGSQCGYCTPGFVMALAAMREEGAPADRDGVGLALSGNLCRCTGYDAIYEAAVAQAAEHAALARERFADPAMVADLALAAGTGAALRWTDADGERAVTIPATVVDALTARRQPCTVVSGGTDVSVVMNKGRAAPASILSLVHLRDLAGIEQHGRRVRIGGATPLREVERWARGAVPAFARLLELFGAPQIRNAGTIAGNIANASPIADSLPFLLAVDAAVELVSLRGRRSVPLAAFFKAYKVTELASDELIAAVSFELPAPDSVHLYKVSKRLDLDISTVTAGFWLDAPDGPGGLVAAARVALGGVAAVPLRLTAVETALTGQPLTWETLAAAGRQAAGLVQPISDVRASRAYRQRVVQNLFLKLAHDLGLRRPQEVSA